MLHNTDVFKLRGIGIRLDRNVSVLHSFKAGFRVHPPFYPIGTRDSFPAGKATGSKVDTSIYDRGSECIQLYLHSPYVSVAWCLVKCRDNFVYHFK